MQLEAAHAVEVIQLMEYVDRKEDPLIQVVKTHQLSSATDRQTSQDRNIERNKDNKGQHSRENERKMAREEDARTNATKLR